MSKSVVRDSKYRHVFGKAAPKEGCYEGLNTAGVSAPDSNLVAANRHFFALSWKGGGGPFVVHPIACAGKLERVVDKEMHPPCVFNGHSGAVLDLEFAPLHDTVVASASEDMTVRVWNFQGKLSPTAPLASDIPDTVATSLTGHGKKATLVRWHPVASHILLSASFDNTLRVWDAEAGKEALAVALEDTPQHVAWAYDGAFAAVVTKDKKIALCDPRARGVAAQIDAHAGTKGARVCFLGRSNMLCSTGFSRQSDRQLFLYDVRQIRALPRVSETLVDQASGSLLPFFDADASLLFLVGKGDCNMRYYEVVESAPLIHYVDQFVGKDPQRGAALCPKAVCDVATCEVARFLRLTDKALEPVSFTVPRKSGSGNEDLYPPSYSGAPGLTAAQWLSGDNASPVLAPLVFAGAESSVFAGAAPAHPPTDAPSPAGKQATPPPKEATPCGEGEGCADEEWGEEPAHEGAVAGNVGADGSLSRRTVAPVDQAAETTEPRDAVPAAVGAAPAVSPTVGPAVGPTVTITFASEKAALAALQARVAELEAENASLRSRLGE